MDEPITELEVALIVAESAQKAILEAKEHLKTLVSYRAISNQEGALFEAMHYLQCARLKIDSVVKECPRNSVHL